MDGDDEITRAADETVAWAMAGDRESFAVLVREHGQAVHAYLARRAGRGVADELLTEVWLRAWRSRGSYDVGWAGPRPWLYGIARTCFGPTGGCELIISEGHSDSRRILGRRSMTASTPSGSVSLLQRRWRH